MKASNQIAVYFNAFSYLTSASMKLHLESLVVFSSSLVRASGVSALLSSLCYGVESEVSRDPGFDPGASERGCTVAFGSCLESAHSLPRFNLWRDLPNSGAAVVAMPNALLFSYSV